MSSETYLGDGLYASFDGYSIWLRAPHPDREHTVALEPSVFAALIDFAKRCEAQARHEHAQEEAKFEHTNSAVRRG